MHSSIHPTKYDRSSEEDQRSSRDWGIDEEVAEEKTHADGSRRMGRGEAIFDSVLAGGESNEGRGEWSGDAEEILEDRRRIPSSGQYV